VNRLKKILRGLMLAPVALFLLFEEWGWEPLAVAFAALGRLPWWARLERFISGLPPWAALLAFGVPVIALIPIKLLALYLFGEGHITLGLGLILAAKLAGTAMAARLFQLTQPALMRMAWFARLYTPWKSWKDKIIAQARASRPWRMARRLKTRVKLAGARLLAALKAVFSEG
jgi:hypothetical protein